MKWACIEQSYKNELNYKARVLAWHALKKNLSVCGFHVLYKKKYVSKQKIQLFIYEKQITDKTIFR